MRHPLSVLTAVLFAFVLASCQDEGSQILSPNETVAAFDGDCNPNAKGGPTACPSEPPDDDGGDGGDDGDDGGGNAGDGDSLATQWTILDSTAHGDPTAINSDGRAGGPYVDGECGVSSIINVAGGSDDALLRTDWRRIHPRDRDACDGREDRYYEVDLSGTVADAPDRGSRTGTFGNINRVGRVAPGESTTAFGAAFNLQGCNLRVGRIKDGEENYPGTDDVRITRSGEGDGPSTWTVESTDGHVAMCVTDFGDGSAGSMQGDLHVVPFRIMITDLERAPADPF